MGRDEIYWGLVYEYTVGTWFLLIPIFRCYINIIPSVLSPPPPPTWCYINSFQHQGSACRENRISILQKPMFMAHNFKVISFLSNFPQVSSQKENSIENGDRAKLINCLNLTGIQFFTRFMLTLVSCTLFCFDVPWRCGLFFLLLTRKQQLFC